MIQKDNTWMMRLVVVRPCRGLARARGPDAAVLGGDQLVHEGDPRPARPAGGRHRPDAGQDRQPRALRQPRADAPARRAAGRTQPPRRQEGGLPAGQRRTRRQVQAPRRGRTLHCVSVEKWSPFY